MLGEAKNNARGTSINSPDTLRKVFLLLAWSHPLLTLRDEYPEFLRTNDAKRVSENSFLLEEFLMREMNAGKLSLNFRSGGRKALLHGHCHQKASVGTAPTVAVLKSAGFEVSEFGLLRYGQFLRLRKRTLRFALTIGNRRLAPAVKAASAEEIVAPGISCRQQIEHLTGRKAKHPAEVLWETPASRGLRTTS